MRTFFLILSICFLTLACNQPKVTITPAEPTDKSVAAPEVSPEERMRASVTVVAEKTWDDGSVHLYSRPGLHLGNGVILANPFAEPDTKTRPTIRYRNADGESAEVDAEIVAADFDFDLLVLCTEQGLPVPEAELKFDLPDLGEVVQTSQHEGIVNKVELYRQSRRFRVLFRSPDRYWCSVGEAIYDLQGKVLGVCSNGRFSLWSVPEGYDRTEYVITPSAQFRKFYELREFFQKKGRFN